MPGRLIIVPTPIGNLEDITLRAIRTLKEVQLILAEDTRTTGNLLKRYDVGTKTVAYHRHNEHAVTDGLLEKLKGGMAMALVSDAGTPGISDAGFLLVRECIREGMAVEALPGPAAFVPALVASGLPCDRFCFEGFLPVKKGRQTRLKQLAAEERTMVFYESPHRLMKTLEQFAEYFGAGRPVCVSREMTKIYEEHVRGTMDKAIAHFGAGLVKGEFVLVVGGAAL